MSEYRAFWRIIIYAGQELLWFSLRHLKLDFWETTKPASALVTSQFKTLLNLYLQGPFLCGDKGLEPLLKPLGLKDALMMFGTITNEPKPIREELTMSCSI